MQRVAEVRVLAVVDIDETTGRITLANGTFQFVTISDPGRLLLTDQPTDLGVMDVTQLRGISKTAAYFHNNSAATLEEVLDPYDAFFRRVARLNPPPNLPPLLSSNGLVVDRGFVTQTSALLCWHICESFNRLRRPK